MKNKTKKRVGIVAMMLMLVVAIGATAGTTLAKYISSATISSETATVAQWGYTVTTNASELFSKAYSDGKKVTASAAGGTVDVFAESKIVAPGTSSATAEEAAGQLTFTVNGSAQVDAQLVIDIKEFETVWLDTAKVKTSDTTFLGTDKYYPLKWTLTAGGEKADLNLAYNATKDFKTQLAEGIANALKYSIDQKMNVLPTGATNVVASGSKVTIDLPMGTTFSNFKFTVAWEWPFTQNKDVEDTVLGWLAANVAGGTSYNGTSDVTVSGLTSLASGTDYNLSAKFGCSVQVVQVQTKDQNPAF